MKPRCSFFRKIFPRSVLPDAERRALIDELFVFGKESQRPFLNRMAMLLLVSTVIAVCGLLSDSAAVVIGAMLVAPMMRPVMSSAAAISLGWSDRFYQSIFLVWAMAVIAVVIAIVLTFLSPDRFGLTDQVVARTVPTFFDLVIAFAAGAGGAYTMTHKETSAIPGVAMAVALLPPLASCGILIAVLEWDLALKAFFLFFINFAAMVLSAALMFMYVGILPEGKAPKCSFIKPVMLCSFTALIAAVSYPLYFYSQDIWYDDLYKANASVELQNWLNSNQLQMQGVEIDEERRILYLQLVGPNPPLNIDQLHRAISRVKNETSKDTRDIRIEVTWSQSANYSWPPQPLDERKERLLKQNNSALYAEHSWRWIGTQYADGDWLRPKKIHDYVIAAQSDNALRVKTACEEEEGAYRLDQEKISVQLALEVDEHCATEKIDSRFVADINKVNRINVTSQRLLFSLEDEDGAMHFVKFSGLSD